MIGRVRNLFLLTESGGGWNHHSGVVSEVHPGEAVLNRIVGTAGLPRYRLIENASVATR